MVLNKWWLWQDDDRYDWNPKRRRAHQCVRDDDKRASFRRGKRREEISKKKFLSRWKDSKIVLNDENCAIDRENHPRGQWVTGKTYFWCNLVSCKCGYPRWGLLTSNSHHLFFWFNGEQKENNFPDPTTCSGEFCFSVPPYHPFLVSRIIGIYSRIKRILYFAFIQYVHKTLLLSPSLGTFRGGVSFSAILYPWSPAL